MTFKMIETAPGKWDKQAPENGLISNQRLEL